MKTLMFNKLVVVAYLLFTVLLAGCGGGGGGGASTGQLQVPGENPPTIGGSPATAITQSLTYSFLPTTNDVDGDSLIYSVSNLPSWASFNSSTGVLSGTPSANQVGSYAGIEISVSDGAHTASLPAFSIEVLGTATGTATLSWVSPTQNSDGSPLTDLAGYRVYYGLTAGSYANNRTITNAGISTFMVENLSPGQWHFVITAFDSSGNESSFSNDANKTI